MTMEQRIRRALEARFSTDVAEGARLENLGGHASLRIYWRIVCDGAFPRGESTEMAMVLPQSADALKSEEGGSPSDPVPSELPFVAVHRYLSNLDLPVPAIDHVDMDLGVLLLEDLGETLFEDVWRDSHDARVYREAIELLVSFQRAVLDDASHDCICFERRFDAELLRWELDHWLEWGLDALFGDDHLAADVRAETSRQFDSLVDALLDLPTALVLRDYQSRNIMQKHGAWYLIDFQDALVGPFVYDLVALLRDSYVELDADLVDELVGFYAACGADAGLPWCAEEDGVHRAFHLQTVQRKLKDAGRFVYIDRVKDNPDFLPYYEPSLGYVRNALARLDDFFGPFWSEHVVPEPGAGSAHFRT